MPRMPTIATERRAARAVLRATRRDAAMTTAEQAARAARLREIGREAVRRHRRLLEIARDMHEQLQEAAQSRAALVVENAALVAERDALREALAKAERRHNSAEAAARLHYAKYAELHMDQVIAHYDQRDHLSLTIEDGPEQK